VLCSDVRGRQPASALGELSEDRPKPLPRQKRLQEDDDDERPAVHASRTSPNLLDRKTPTRRTPTGEQRMTPVDRHKSPADDRDPFASRHRMDDNDRSYQRGESRHSPLGRNSFTDRKSPRSDEFRMLPRNKYELEEGKDSFDGHGASRKSPSGRRDSAERNTPLSDRQLSSAFSRKTSLEGDKFMKYDRQKSPVDDRKTPTSDRRRTPVSFRQKKEESPVARRKGSVLDLLTDSTGVKESENSDEEKEFRDRRKSGSLQSRGRKSTSPSSKRSESVEKNPFEDIRKFPGTTSKASKQNRSSESLDRKPARPRSQVCAFLTVYYADVSCALLPADLL